VDFVDEQHIAGFQLVHQPDDVARALKARTGAQMNAGAHFVSDNTGQRGLA
jgi:hypothetical protein